MLDEPIGGRMDARNEIDGFRYAATCENWNGVEFSSDLFSLVEDAEHARDRGEYPVQNTFYERKNGEWVQVEEEKVQLARLIHERNEAVLQALLNKAETEWRIFVYGPEGTRAWWRSKECEEDAIEWARKNVPPDMKWSVEKVG